MTKVPQDTSAEEPDGGNLQVRLRRGPGSGDRPGLLNSARTCASSKALRTLAGISAEDARRIRRAWREATRGELLAEFPCCADYVQQCFNPPGTRELRRLAVDSIARTYGVEHLGVSRKTGEPVYYCNADDTYAPTILFSGPHLRVGTWGDRVERGSIREAQS